MSQQYFDIYYTGNLLRKNDFITRNERKTRKLLTLILTQQYSNFHLSISYEIFAIVYNFS